MFKFFKKKHEPVLFTPIEGKCIPIEQVPDQVFAKKMMGEGIAFIPSSNQVFAPCDATVSMIASTHHAIGLINEDGVEILIHIGLDTVNYQGKGFKVYVEKNERVKKGELLIEFDKDFFESENVSLITPMIITNYRQFRLDYLKQDENVTEADVVLRYEKIS